MIPRDLFHQILNDSLKHQHLHQQQLHKIIIIIIIIYVTENNFKCYIFLLVIFNLSFIKTKKYRLFFRGLNKEEILYYYTRYNNYNIKFIKYLYNIYKNNFYKY